MRVLWFAGDGSKHTIEGEDMQEVQQKISELREIYNIKEPAFVAAQVNNPEKVNANDFIDFEKLPKDMQKHVNQAISDSVKELSLKINKKKD